MMKYFSVPAPHNPDETIRRELQAGEELLWVGRPRRGLCFRTHDIVLIPFSLAWCSFAIYWEYTAWQTQAPPIFLAFGVPFVAAGLYFVAGRFFVEAYIRSTAIYGLTNRRVVVSGGIHRARIVSHAIAGLGRIELVEHRDGTGTILLGERTGGLRSLQRDGSSFWIGWSMNRLDVISEARCVYNRILELQSSNP
jgi:hypothetical protein